MGWKDEWNHMDFSGDAADIFRDYAWRCGRIFRKKGYGREDSERIPWIRGRCHDRGFRMVSAASGYRVCR